MRSSKENASQPQFIILDEGTRASQSKSTDTSGPSQSRENASRTDVSDHLNTQDSVQPSDQDQQSGNSAGSPSEPVSDLYQGVLIDSNALVERYRKGSLLLSLGEVIKAYVYVEIQANLARALGNDRTRSDAAFGSFIVTIESHDTETGCYDFKEL